MAKVLPKFYRKNSGIVNNGKKLPIQLAIDISQECNLKPQKAILIFVSDEAEIKDRILLNHMWTIKIAGKIEYIASKNNQSQALAYWSEKLGISVEEILNIVKNFTPEGWVL